MWSIFNFVASSLGFKKDEELGSDQEEEYVEALQTNESTEEYKLKHILGCKTEEKIGTVTNLSGNTAIIDNEYYFNMDELSFPLSIGDTVLFTVHYNDCHTFVKNVYKLLSSNEEKKISEELTEIDASKLTGQVIKRHLRVFEVKIDDLKETIKFDLDTVKTEFIPCPGDYLELLVIGHNPHDLDSTGIKVIKIKPKKYALKLGVVTSLFETHGTISNFASFTNGVCQPGFHPMLDQRVFASLVRSDCENGFKWRAIQLIPQDSIISEYSTSEEKRRLENEYRNKQGVSISMAPKLFLNLNSHVDLTIDVTNKSSLDKVVYIYPISSTDQDQIFLKHPSPNKIKIKPEETVEYLFRISGKFVGSSYAEFIWDFGDFRIRRKISFEVVCDSLPEVNTDSITLKTSFSKHITAKWVLENTKGDIMPGRRHSSNSVFVPVKIGQFLVPNKILATALPEAKMSFKEIKMQVGKVLPYLRDGLNQENYQDYMHSLLFLEEIDVLKQMAKLEIVGTSFRKHLDYMILDVPEYSLYTKLFVPGDFVIACLPWNKQKKQQGIIHRVTKTELWLKFAKSFHDNYKEGTIYFVSFAISRTSLRRMHEAVDIAVKHLGKEWLFPNCLYLRKPQVIIQELDNGLGKLATNIKDFNKHVFEESDNPFTKRQSQNNFKKNRKGMWNRSGAGCGNYYNDNEYHTNLPTINIHKITWYNEKLNHYQKEAVIRILRGESRPLPYILFGPPGTGKTVTVIESILQIHHLLPKSRILVATPTNSAADLIAERLLDSGNLQDGDFLRLVGMNYAEQGKLTASLVPYSATVNFRDGPVNENEASSDVQSFSRYQISEHRIIVGTLGSIGILYNMGFPRGFFTHIFIDEAGQTTEPESLIAMSFLSVSTGHVILSGDPLQLGPVVLSNLASEYGFSESLLLRLINRFPYAKDPQGFPDSFGYDPRLVTKLINNYRSLKGILNLFSSLFYEGDLVAMVSNENSDEAMLLKNLKSSKLNFPVLFHGVQGTCLQEEQNKSWYNPQEIFQTFVYINKLYLAGLKPDHIGIITPYQLQTRKILKTLEFHNLEPPKVGSVEEFQGQEKMVIIISLVKCTDDTDELTNINFVIDPKRMNVAISRARALLIIIGDPNVLCTNINWLKTIKYCHSNNSYIGCELPSSIFMNAELKQITV